MNASNTHVTRIIDAQIENALKTVTAYSNPLDIVAASLRELEISASHFSRDEFPRGLKHYIKGYILLKIPRPNSNPLSEKNEKVFAELKSLYGKDQDLRSVRSLVDDALHGVKYIRKSKPRYDLAGITRSNDNLVHPTAVPPAVPPPPVPLNIFSLPSISADSLRHLLSSAKILLIDLRPKAQFLSHHIDHIFILCIDPSLVLNCESDQQLQNLIDLTDNHSSSLFRQRNMFDRVVYYTEANTEADVLCHLFSLLSSFKHHKSNLLLLKGGNKGWWDHADLPRMKPAGPRPEVQFERKTPERKTPERKTPERKIPERKIPERFKVKQIETRKPERQQMPLPTGPLSLHLSLPQLFEYYGVCGLQNSGTTCYINAMIQCLVNLSPVCETFTSNSYKKYVQAHETELLSHSVSALFKTIQRNGGRTVTPKLFLQTCAYLRPDLRIPHVQQDTQEFVLFVLDRLHDELKFNQAVAKDFPLAVCYASSDPEYLKWYENCLQKEGVSPITNYFGGQLESCIQCQTCGTRSSNFSRFSVLSLAIPLPTTNRYVTINDCIDLFTAPETMSGDNAWACPKCYKEEEPDLHHKKKSHLVPSFGKRKSKSPRRREEHTNVSVKALRFLSLPPFLIIHLSRFQTMMDDSTNKLRQEVEYPLILEMSSRAGNVRYKLNSLVNHLGDLKCGHYTSLANKSQHLKDPFWCFFDDDKVRAVTHGDLKTCPSLVSGDVYVLLYQLIS